MKILTRAILKLFFRLLGLCLGAFSLIFLIIEIFDKMRRFSRTQTDLFTIFLYFLNKLPEMLLMALPFSMLLATILALGTLARTNELTAMRSSGISLNFIARPLLAAAFVVSLLTFGANELLLPITTRNIRDIEEGTLKRNSSGAVFRQHNIWYREGNLVMQARLFEPTQLSLKGVTVWKTGKGIEPVERIDATEGILTTSGWQLRQAVRHEFQGAIQTSVTRIPTLLLPIKLSREDLRNISDYAGSMGFFELRRYTRKLRQGGFDVTRYLADMQARIALPFSSCVMVLLGMPFAVRSGRSVSTAMGVGQGLAIGFIYFVLNAILISLGHNGLLPALVAAWSANIIFAMAGAWLLLTLEQ